MAVVSCPECGCDVDAENLDELLQCAECHYQFFHVPPKKQSSEIPLMKTTLSEGKKHNEKRVRLFLMVLPMVFFIGIFMFGFWTGMSDTTRGDLPVLSWPTYSVMCCFFAVVGGIFWFWVMLEVFDP